MRPLLAGVLTCCGLLGGCTGTATRPANPSTAVQCSPAPLGETTLYLRGAMSSWAALEEYAFIYQCDAYLLNVDLLARQDFKIADAQWSMHITFGAPAATAGRLLPDQDYSPARGSEPGGTGNLNFAFDGTHTIALRLSEGAAPTIRIGPQRFADPRNAPVSDPLALSLRFDSRNSAHKYPFGAVIPGARIDYRLSAQPGVEAVTLVVERRRLEGNQDVLEYTELERMPMQRSRDADDRGTEHWQISYTPAQIGVYGYWFEVQIGAQRYMYQNNKDQIFWTRERGSGGLGAVSVLPAQPAGIRRFRQTVHAADFSVPEWAPDIVYYYIFPERFRNGNTSNDPTPGKTRFRDGTVEFHTDWNERPFLSGTGDDSDSRYSNDFFGGDLAGITEKLDYLQQLGINTLYLTPIFSASTNHKYDTADYFSIDPGFGTPAEFEQLTAAARQRGIRIMLDASLNHSGSDSIYFDRYRAYPQLGAFEGGQVRADSPYGDWYRFDPQANAAQPYQGWTGVADLPELNKSSASFRAFAYGPGGVTQHWLERGASGWRMDVAPWVPDDFWREWRSAVKQHDPDALTVAETWFDASKHLLGDMFDATMNYIFRNTVLEYAAGGRADRLYANIEHLREAYPQQALYAAMNLLSTHDSARSLHLLGYHDAQTPVADIALAKRRYRLALLFQMSFPGSPAVFYADEVGVTGGDDPFNRVTYPWADRGGQPDLAMLDEFKRLIAMRHAHPVLRRGTLDAPLYIDEHLIVLLRRLPEQSAIVVLNNAQEARTIELKLPPTLADQRWNDALSDFQAHSEGENLKVEVPALYGRVLIEAGAVSNQTRSRVFGSPVTR